MIAWTEPDLSFLAVYGDAVQAEVVALDEVEVRVEERQPLGPVLAQLGSCLDIREIHSFPITLHDVYVRTLGVQPETLEEVAA